MIFKLKIEVKITRNSFTGNQKYYYQDAFY